MSNKTDKISPLGKRILERIRSQRLTKKYVYDSMKISRGTLDNWISGTTAPDHNELELMFKILGIDVKPQPSFRDEIFEGEYIGMHKRVWTEHELTMATHRELLKDLVATVKNLTQAGNG